MSPLTNVDMATLTSHKWAYDHDLSTYVLQSCPPGHQLINTTNGVFNPTLQRCQACGTGFYIIDSSGPCLKCPKGALPDGCEDGSQLVPTDWGEVGGKEQGSKWEDVYEDIDGEGAAMRRRLVECPAGYSMNYQQGIPVDDECIPCPLRSYRLNRVYRNSSTPHCIVCDTSVPAFCPGRDAVIADAGFWQLKYQRFDGYVYLKEIECKEEGKECLYPR
jgi:hypothetical protein